MREDNYYKFDISVEVESWCKKTCPYFEIDENNIYAENMLLLTTRKCRNLDICRNAIKYYLKGDNEYENY